LPKSISPDWDFAAPGQETAQNSDMASHVSRGTWKTDDGVRVPAKGDTNAPGLLSVGPEIENEKVTDSFFQPQG